VTSRVLKFGSALVFLALVAPACGTDGDGTSDGADTAAPNSDERCAINEAQGTLTYVSGFDFSASTGILDVIVADAEGYFDELCLDVEVQPGFAPGNSAAVAGGAAEFGAAGSFGELVNGNVEGDAGLVAFGQYGHTAIEALVVPADGDVQALSDIPGTIMGVKGDIPYSVQAMLALEGVERGTYEELLLDGFDPISHLESGIHELPVYKSNEPNTLDNAGVAYLTFDPLDFDVPSSFAVMFTRRDFLDGNPTVVEDFMRASIKGFEFANENPEAAVAHAFELIDAAGNPLFLAQDQELYRWTTEKEIVAGALPSELELAMLNPERLGEEIALLTDLGVYESLPDWETMIDTDIVAALYDGSDLVWPF
jgi:ABC-type nitrate/sulfonate/bicarbonate transport system substrate-binding protein